MLWVWIKTIKPVNFFFFDGWTSSCTGYFWWTTWQLVDGLGMTRQRMMAWTVSVMLEASAYLMGSFGLWLLKEWSQPEISHQFETWFRLRWISCDSCDTCVRVRIRWKTFLAILWQQVAATPLRHLRLVADYRCQLPLGLQRYETWMHWASRNPVEWGLQIRWNSQPLTSNVVNQLSYLGPPPCLVGALEHQFYFPIYWE